MANIDMPRKAKHPRRFWSPQDDELLTELVRQRRPTAEIAAVFNVSPGALSVRIGILGITRYKRAAEWSEGELALLKQRYEAHVPLKDIAKELCRPVCATKLRVHKLGLVRSARATRLATRYGVDILATGSVEQILDRVAEEATRERAAAIAAQQERLTSVLANARKAIDAGVDRGFVFTAALVGGCTLQRIGDEFGLTRERVRQLIEAAKSTDGQY